MNIAGGLEKLSGALKRISPTWWRVIRVMWLRRGRSVSNIMAAAIGFYALICLGPLALLVAWALQLLMGQGGRSYEWIRVAVNRMAGDTAGAIMDQVNALLTNPNAHIAGIFSLLLLIWAGLRLFEALEISLTEIWPGQEQRGVIARKLIALVMMVLSGLLFIVAVLLMAFIPTVTSWLTRLTGLTVNELIFLQPGMRLVIETAIAFAAFFLLFRFIPAQQVPTRVASVGAAFTAVTWRAATPIFTMVVARSAEGSTIYGGLAGVVMFLTWAFFGAHILLLGAHLSAAYDHVICLERPESLDTAFIRMRPHIEDVRDARPSEEDEQQRGPSSYPPPGRV